jgi:DNA-binding response OmpR family regulator
VDLDLAEMETCNLAAELLRYSEVLTILMSARHDEPHVVRALQSGGDMFVAKPFSMRELVVRVDSLLRRLSDDMPLGSDALILDPARHAVIKHGQEIRLSPKEFQLIACLMRWEGQVVPHDVLLREVWGPEYEGERGLLALYIYYLRQKIEDDPAHPVYIHTRTRIGYCFSRLAQSFCLCPTEAPRDTDS